METRTEVVQTTRTIYIASDGTEYQHRSFCEAHERELERARCKDVIEKLPYFWQPADYEGDYDARIHWYYISNKDELTAVLMRHYNEYSNMWNDRKIWDETLQLYGANWYAFYVDRDGCGKILGTAKDFFKELQEEYIDDAIRGMNGRCAAAPEPDPKMRLCEAVFDISLQAQCLLEQRRIKCEDSRELFASIYQWAREFEPTEHKDYLGEIEEFGYAKLVGQYAK